MKYAKYTLVSIIFNKKTIMFTHLLRLGNFSLRIALTTIILNKRHPIPRLLDASIVTSITFEKWETKIISNFLWNIMH